MSYRMPSNRSAGGLSRLYSAILWIVAVTRPCQSGRLNLRIPVQSVHGHAGCVEFGDERAQAFSIPRDRPPFVNALRLIRQLQEQIGDALGPAKLNEESTRVRTAGNRWSLPEPHRSSQRSARFLAPWSRGYFCVAARREGDVPKEYPPRSLPVRQEDEAGQFSACPIREARRRGEPTRAAMSSRRVHHRGKTQRPRLAAIPLAPPTRDRQCGAPDSLSPPPPARRESRT